MVRLNFSLAGLRFKIAMYSFPVEYFALFGVSYPYRTVNTGIYCLCLRGKIQFVTVNFAIF